MALCTVRAEAVVLALLLTAGRGGATREPTNQTDPPPATTEPAATTAPEDGREASRRLDGATWWDAISGSSSAKSTTSFRLSTVVSHRCFSHSTKRVDGQAASNLRRRDIDLDRGTMRFREKGNKVITKPIPEEFAVRNRPAIRLRAIGASPDSYVILMPRGQRREGDRDDRIIWRTIKKLGERAGVEVHPHSLRAAFACASSKATQARSRRSSG